MAATTSYHFDVLLFHHNMPQAADTTVVEGKPSEGDGFVGPVTQGLGVPTEGLGHI